jgi:hypothetical protein
MSSLVDAYRCILPVCTVFQGVQQQKKSGTSGSRFPNPSARCLESSPRPRLWSALFPRWRRFSRLHPLSSLAEANTRVYFMKLHVPVGIASRFKHRHFFFCPLTYQFLYHKLLTLLVICPSHISRTIFSLAGEILHIPIAFPGQI